jgi:hypothetical protein
MLLLVTPSAKAKSWAQAIQQAISEETQVATTLSQALAHLRSHEYLAVLIDQALLEAEPDESETLLEHIGTAIPVTVNFSISGMDRVLRELRAALHRRKKELTLACRGAQQALRNELKGTVTALLLSCEMALRVPNLQEAAEEKLRTVYELAQEMRVKLDATV